MNEKAEKANVNTASCAKFVVIATIALLVSACASTQPVSSLPPAAHAMPTAGIGYIPAGYKDYCTRSPENCGARSARTDRIALSPQNWRLLVAVNAEFNRKIVAATDQDIFGTPEYWTIPTTTGDCEDFAMAKQLALIARGVPDAALSIATAMDPGLGLHAVLMVRTDRGDFVLDNKTSEIRHWDATPYQWISRQSAAHAMQWERPASRAFTGPVVSGPTANR